MPIHTAGKGSHKVTVNTHGRGRFVVTWYWQGARRRVTRTSRSAAITFAQAKASELASGMASKETLTDAVLAEIDAARSLLDLNGGGSFLLAIRDYTAARKLVPDGETLLSIVQRHVALNPSRGPVPMTAEAVRECIASRARRNRSGRHLAGLADLHAFAKAFPRFGEATADAIEGWLFSLRTKRARTVEGERRPAGSVLSPRRRDNIRDAVSLFFEFARGKGWVLSNPCTSIPRLATGPEVTTFQPAELWSVLSWFEANAVHLLPWVVLGAFAGMRSSEILRLEWSAFHWSQHTIAVSARVAGKVRVGRRVPILPPVEQWLAPWVRASGRVVEVGAHVISRTLRRFAKETGMSHWPINVLRHSYGSYRLGALGFDFTRVAGEMGTSPAMLRKHYIAPPEPDAVAGYWKLLPPEKKNVINLTNNVPQMNADRR